MDKVMITDIYTKITSKEQAEAFLTELYNNMEAFHPDDPITAENLDVSEDEAENLQSRIDEVFSFLEDPCELLMDLIKQEIEELEKIKLDNPEPDVVT